MKERKNANRDGEEKSNNQQCNLKRRPPDRVLKKENKIYRDANDECKTA